jgi:hypothetical protein
MQENATPHVRFSEHFDTDPAPLLKGACEQGLEGLIGKRADSPYVSNRSPQWIKLKCTKRQEFVIIGYTDPKGSRSGFGSLVLGIHDAQGKLHYAGNVGTGFDESLLRSIKEKVAALETPRSAVDPAPKGVKAHWVRPKLVAEVAFTEWTSDGRVRHPVFHGLRTDKDPATITREQAVHAPKAAPPPRRDTETEGNVVRGIKVSNPDRVIDAASGATKLDLVRYYDRVADHILPHLIRRPVALVRAPSGVTGQLFFQKHGDTVKVPGIKELDRKYWPEHDPMLEIDTPRALVGAAQMNMVELHTVELHHQGDRQARPHALRPGSRRGHHLGAARRGHRDHEEIPRHAGPRELPQDQRRQGLARGGAPHAEGRLRHGEGFLAGGGRASRAHAAEALRGEGRRQEPHRAHLHRLPAKRQRRDHGERLLRARASRPGRFGDAGMEGAREARKRLAVEHLLGLPAAGQAEGRSVEVLRGPRGRRSPPLPSGCAAPLLDLGELDALAAGADGDEPRALARDAAGEARQHAMLHLAAGTRACALGSGQRSDADLALLHAPRPAHHVAAGVAGHAAIDELEPWRRAFVDAGHHAAPARIGEDDAGSCRQQREEMSRRGPRRSARWNRPR